MKSNPIFAQDLKSIFKPLIIICYQPIIELIIGFKEKSLPLAGCLAFGIVASQIHYWCLYHGFLHFAVRSHLGPAFDSGIGVGLVFSGLWAWGVRQIGVRRILQTKLEEVFAQANLKTKMNEYPQFVFDRPVGSNSRKLRLRARGLPLQYFKNAILEFESGLVVHVSKIETPNNNKELVDIIYSLEKIPEFWELTEPFKYKDFSFPIGKAIGREIVTNLRKIPHYLIAGETNSGKSTFIRSLVGILLQNNFDLRVFFVDMKGEVDAQVFKDHDRVETLSELSKINEKFTWINSQLDMRMSEAKEKKVKNIDEYNKEGLASNQRWDRILVVVDEIAELMPSLNSSDKAKCAQIQNHLNRFTRLGRAMGIHVVVGVQKPDHKNLDPTIKANLPGIVCFPVSHFTQSTLILGNGHAAELNASIVGRGIWKYGMEEVEIQAPFLTVKELESAKNIKGQYFPGKGKNPEEKDRGKKENSPVPTAYQPGNPNS